eukprot:CAMPEP_0197252484 /NCGR_PEP_ID=MMETSP1429-20130617/61599_1 /TAXON_ID=49237 /ORGANISM="Chaetoceros  sp., Strain UNC1202" /LENGTH=324 /DNA_ID=CAMNT_0042714883 /DNA_START=37 /DNA_END=1011 /DNA_ORIENTATION=-
MEDMNYALEVSPETALQFTLTRDGDKSTDGAARCIMTLKHPGNSKHHLAFKVKTTQPRRYLVRPNQGIVAPGTSETVNILLVEKDKQMLLQSFDRLGQSALDHSKDKFLVQSCIVDEAFAKDYVAKKAKSSENSSVEASKAAKDLAESLTSMWNTSSSREDVLIYNKKLQVRHVVASSPTDAKAGPAPGQTSRSVGGHTSERTSLENMTTNQMFMEISSLSRKYDELVTFSVNLTAERDILNNTLEQTKRDLNREIANKSKNRGVADVAPETIKKSSGFLGSFIFFLFVAIVSFLCGAKLVQLEQISTALHEAPVLGDLMKMEL